MSITITTEEELKKAIANKEPEFTVEGELAEKLNKSKKIATLGKAGIAAIAALGVGGVTTGGLGYFALLPVAAMTGISIPFLIFVIMFGIYILRDLFKDYDDVCIKVAGVLKIHFKRKQA